jgi:hypothetical protein
MAASAIENDSLDAVNESLKQQGFTHIVMVWSVYFCAQWASKERRNELAREAEDGAAARALSIRFCAIGPHSNFIRNDIWNRSTATYFEVLRISSYHVGTWRSSGRYCSGCLSIVGAASLAIN